MNTYIIAEIGCNHNGDINLAYEMVDAAIESGVDAVKFQSFKAENLVTKQAEMAEYAKENMQSNESQFEMIKKLELSFDEFKNLFSYLDSKGIDWFSTPFDDDSIYFLSDLGMNTWKIPSGDVNNLPYLEKIGSFGGRVIISTGMATVEEMDTAIKILQESGTTDITILHCITEYPAPDCEMNLSTIPMLQKRYPDCNVGLSDHSLGDEAAIASVALGATMVEKHFTLDTNMPGPDHKASATPDVMKKIVDGIRRIEVMKGQPKMVPTESELKNIPIARKSIIAKTEIKTGELFTEENLTIKRPGDGLSPMKWYDVIGTKAEKDYQADEKVVL